MSCIDNTSRKPHRRSCHWPLLLIVVGMLRAQEFPAPDADPRGVVLDERLAPVQDATVTLLWETNAERPFARAYASCLQETPLPQTRTGRDGMFVLPLTEQQRAMGAVGWNPSGCWLVVEKADYVTWCEPIPGGLGAYLGSRVILRRRSDGDLFRDVPWPPAIVSMTTETSMAPWLAVGMAPPAMDRRGAAELLQVAAAANADRIATLDLRVSAGGKPLPRAAVAFDDLSFTAATPMPSRVDDEGELEIALPAGEHQLRITAAGHLTRDVTVVLKAAARTRCDVQLPVASVVDVLAVTPGGVPVPFVRLDVIPKRGQTEDRQSFFAFTDSSGRARLFLDEPDEWYVYGDFGQVCERFDLVSRSDGSGSPVRVTKKWPVTVRIAADDWPTRGEIYWNEVVGGQVTRRGFEFLERAPAAVIMRMVYRDDACVTIGGDGGVPFVIRITDLPPAPKEPLLDLVAIDRSLRPRAIVEPHAANGGSLSRFAVRPPWQTDAATPLADLVMFARWRSRRWTLFARDDVAMDVVATAAKHLDLPFTVAARRPGTELPILPLELAHK